MASYRRLFGLTGLLYVVVAFLPPLPLAMALVLPASGPGREPLDA